MGLIRIMQYRDFWDVPRIFLIRRDNSLLLFDCKFDEEKEDYEDNYHVYVMPELAEEEISGSWTRLSEKATKYLGKVAVAKVKFDETLREFVDDAIVP